jgi:RNA polymerase sigma-70 factor (ECF subfamily)
MNMDGQQWLAERFEQNRDHMRAVAYRMLGSASEADDAVQEAWLRLNRSDAGEIDNLGGWLTTVVARICLDTLRSRKSRKEEPVELGVTDPPADRKSDPEREAILADSVGLALLVVLDRLTPAERLAFVLHDMFAISFEEIGDMVGRSAVAARQLASRARKRVQGVPAATRTQLNHQREIVDRFLAALRAGDVERLVAVLDPEFVIRVDQASMVAGGQREVHGAENWANQAVKFYKGARFAAPAMVDGVVGIVVAPKGRLFRILRFTFAEDRIAAIEVIGDKEDLSSREIAPLMPDSN